MKIPLSTKYYRVRRCDTHIIKFEVEACAEKITLFPIKIVIVF